MGAPVRQRRSGTAQVPSGLRRRGVTVREFEVARLLAERIGNKDIGNRLHISPRTVEKHVASLLQKTGHPDRAAFATAARELAQSVVVADFRSPVRQLAGPEALPGSPVEPGVNRRALKRFQPYLGVVPVGDPEPAS